MLVRIDLQTGERSVIADDPDADLEHPAISPDGTAVAFTRETLSTPHAGAANHAVPLGFGFGAS